MATKAASEPDTDDGSLTPSEPSDEERSEHDSDYETEHEDDETEGEQPPNIAWTGYGKKTPVIVFKGDAVIKKRTDCKAVGERYHMAFKMGSSDCRIVRNILSSHGFKEVHPSSSDYNIMWTGSHLKPFTLRSLTEFQKINHFPRSYEITRKDRLFKNVQRMQQIRGARHFDFVAQSFIMPTEYQDFCTCFMKEKGTWIVKPVASSRGRGVFLINHPDQVPLDENLIVSKYIANPILIDGFKFDVRLYIAVTSYDPIVIYLFEEGLTRFATVKYEKANKHIRNQCMHLTNYSVNKKNKDYVQNDDPDVEDYGNKWSLGALLRYLKSQQKDVTALMMRIEDVIIKTIMSAELPIATACKMFMPYRGNCFELYGFDILIDDNLKPWVLEVNLSPSLACDAPLDLKIKANMISDLLSLSGLMCQDPMLRSLQQSRRNHELSSKFSSRIKSAHVRTISSARVTKPRPQSAGAKSMTVTEKPQSASMAGLTSEEIKIVRRVKEEEARKGGWVRIFPSPDSWDLYGPFLQFSTTHNAMLHQRLYPERHKRTHPVSGKSSTSIGSRNRMVYSQLSATHLSKLDFQGDAYGHALLRTRQYLRKLNNGNDSRKKHRRRRLKSATERAKHSATTRKPLVQGVAEEDGEDEGEEFVEADGADPVSADPVPPPVTEVIDKPVPEEKFQTISEPAEPAQPIKQKEASPKLNLLEMLVRGEGALNKVQARTAFAMYLIRVQQRLTMECNSKNADDVDAMNEQMDLVLRFLKRAAVNLQQPFKVIVPSRKLPINDRRRILAKQLGNFVHIYTKETEQLKIRQESEKKGIKRTSSKECLNEDKFEKFINIASETELEEVLTTYTKLNKSASIFLGTKSPDKGETDSKKVLTKRKELSAPAQQPIQVPQPVSTEPAHPPPAFLGWEEIPSGSKAHMVYLDGADHHSEKRLMRPPSGRLATTPAVYDTPAAAAFANAVAIYSAKLSRSRPSSASNIKPGTKLVGHRPSSAVISRPNSAGKPDRDRGFVDVYNEKAINEALQRLALKQQARQYSATNSTTVGFQELPAQPSRPTLFRSSSQQSVRSDVFRTRSLSTGDSSISDAQAHLMKRLDSGHHSDSRQEEVTPGKYIAIEEHQQSKKPPAGPHKKMSVRGENLGKLTKDSISHNMRTSSTAFNNFVDEAPRPSWHNDVIAAFDQVTGGQHAKTGNRPSYKVTQQQQLAKQQRLMAQSKALLESSKAKHLAMVAQAHAAQGRFSPQSSVSVSSRPASNRSTPTCLTPEPQSTAQQFEPKPPARPASDRKVNSQYRMSRTDSVAGPDQPGFPQYDHLLQHHQYPSGISTVTMK